MRSTVGAPVHGAAPWARADSGGPGLASSEAAFLEGSVKSEFPCALSMLHQEEDGRKEGTTGTPLPWR